MSSPAPVSEECEPLIAALRRLVRSLDRGSRRLMQERGLTAPQITLMRLLAARPGASVGELARSAGMGQATVTDILDRLTARGIVARARSAADRRVADLRLTPAGESLLASLPLPLPAKFVERFDALPPEQRRQLIDAVSWMAVNMDPDTLNEVPNPPE
jgi:DNA-binding MarR family transcriptional regulator